MPRIKLVALVALAVMGLALFGCSPLTPNPSPNPLPAPTDTAMPAPTNTAMPAPTGE